MFKATVTKESVRKATGKKRLPRHLILYVAGSVLHDILQENRVDAHLMHTTYCFTCTSVGRKHCKLAGRFDIRQYAQFSLEQMTRLINRCTPLRRELESYRSSKDFKNHTDESLHEILFRKRVRGDTVMERRYKNA